MSPRDAESLEKDVLDFVRKSEEAALDLGRKWADALAEFVPVEVPLVKDLQKQVFDFVEELLQKQREYAERMLTDTRQAVVGSTKPGATHVPRTTRSSHKVA